MLKTLFPVDKPEVLTINKYGFELATPELATTFPEVNALYVLPITAPVMVKMVFETAPQVGADKIEVGAELILLVTDPKLLNAVIPQPGVEALTLIL